MSSEIWQIIFWNSPVLLFFPLLWVPSLSSISIIPFLFNFDSNPRRFLLVRRLSWKGSLFGHFWDFRACNLLSHLQTLLRDFVTYWIGQALSQLKPLWIHIDCFHVLLFAGVSEALLLSSASSCSNTLQVLWVTAVCFHLRVIWCFWLYPAT